jgi:hypothetical protein
MLKYTAWLNCCMSSVPQQWNSVDGRLGSRLRGYHLIAPTPLRYRPFVQHLQFCPSTPEALHIKQYERPVLIKDGIVREIAGRFGLRFWLPCKSQGFFYMQQICYMGQAALLPLRRKACCGFFHPKNPMASAGFEPVILGTRGQHANH